MNGQTITELCNFDFILSFQFKGVYSCNNLPLLVRSYPSAFIVNTTPSNTRGEHWIAIYFCSRKRCHMFDSFGRPPPHLSRSINEFIARNSLMCTYNSRIIQPLHSQTCGLYCVLYLLFMTRQCDLRHFVNIFSSDSRDNDFIVYHCLYSFFNK
jgi:hypothetical protein